MTRTLLPAILLALLFVSSCEDAPPTDYLPRPYVQGYLLVGEPIQDIIVAVSQPIDQPYDFGSSLVRNAEVQIQVDERIIPLVFREQPGGGSYVSVDSSIRVQPQTTYKLFIRMPDGAVVRAETTTPAIIAWLDSPPDRVQYPRDTTRLAADDSLSVSWTSGGSTDFLVRVMALDTVGYGGYLSPATSEPNARTNNRGERRSINYSLTRWGYTAQSRTQIAWSSFSWFGRNDIAIFSPDRWFLKWFKSVQFSRLSPEYDPQESNISGGIGVFGSAAVISKEMFVQKNSR